MNKNGTSKAKYCIQSEKHPQQTTLGLCSLMEHQSLVDIAICCGSNVLHAHKVVLAASSPLFREELEKNSSIEQVLISGCEFSVIRSLIEFMYCGETIIDEELLKYLVAAARLFQMRSLENVVMDYQFPGDLIILPKPQFLSKKPKYPAYLFNPNVPMNALKPLNYSIGSLYKPHKVRRKYRLEAEHQACVKEAQASRQAIANLKKEIASAPQANTFIIEETCTETTVENFIPHERQNFVEVDFDSINNQMYINPQQFHNRDSTNKSNIIQLTLPNNGQPLTAEKIKDILGNNENSNVEIMFKTSDGSYVTVTDDVLQNLQKDGLQYQVIDEDGRVGEVQELQLLDKDQKDTDEDLPKDIQSADISSVDSFNNIFGNPSLVFCNSTNSVEEPTDLSLNSKKDNDTESQETSASDKAIQFLALNSEDMKSTFIAPSINEEDGYQEVNSFFHEEDSERSNLKQEIVDLNEDKSQIVDVKSRSSLKFSPDIFFADVTNQTNHDSDGPERKKLCFNQKSV